MSYNRRPVVMMADDPAIGTQALLVVTQLVHNCDLVTMIVAAMLSMTITLITINQH